MTEQNVVDAIKQFIEKNGGKVIKFQGTASQEAGTPDLIGGLWGIPFMVEVKQPGDPHPLSPIQAIRIIEWRRQGYVTFVTRSVSVFETAINNEKIWRDGGTEYEN